MQEDHWEEVKELYKERYKIKPCYVDLMADSEILRLCATGLANKSIALTLDLDVECVIDVIVQYKLAKNFCGWEDDLDINPLPIYLNCGTNSFNEFYSKVIPLIEGHYKESFIKTMYKVCKSYDELDRKLDKHWR